MPMVDMVKYYYIKYFICTVFNWVYVQKELESHHNINKAEFYLCFKQHPNVFGIGVVVVDCCSKL